MSQKTSAPSPDLAAAIKTLLDAGYVPMPAEPADTILQEIWLDDSFTRRAICARYAAMLDAGRALLSDVITAPTANE